MPRQARPHIPGTIHHLISRFANREWRLADNRDRAAYLRFIGKAANRFEGRILAFGLMSSHTHLAALSGRQALGTLLHSMHSGFGGWWNRRRGGLGHVFAERPTSVLLSTSEQLARLLAYIHNNPVRGGVVRDPSESTWTSHRAFIGDAAAPPWLNVEWALATAGFSAAPSGRAAFHDYVCSRARLPRDPLLAGPGKLPPYFLELLLHVVAKHCATDPCQIRAPHREATAIHARQITVALAVDEFRMKASDVCKELKLSPSMVTKIRRSSKENRVLEGIRDQLVAAYLRAVAETNGVVG